MNDCDWITKAQKLLDEVEQTQEWYQSNFKELPDCVQKIIVRGQMKTHEKIAKCLELASEAE
ncbi:hypothetical protein IIE26_05005 [Cytobacillus oceanisediminis]|uniref:hypothetical protein n=1 Tax=Cytobacillus oceanisediminis TaxID=665099 RepID=UPI001864FE69|nr:hypothetical protein [Cytobacillus oceanisediminis]QOK28032.1 hypothetical protein IIE26_05005 [Cytobacillus oceanisediminis]